MNASPLSILAVTLKLTRGPLQKCVVGSGKSYTWSRCPPTCGSALSRSCSSLTWRAHHYQAAGLPQNFHIIDSDDQQRLLKRTIKALYILDEKQWPAKASCMVKSMPRKDVACGLSTLIHTNPNPRKKPTCKFYTVYQEACESPLDSLIFLAELLLRAHGTIA